MLCANGFVRDKTKTWEGSSSYMVLQSAQMGGRGGWWATIRLEERGMETDIGSCKPTALASANGLCSAGTCSTRVIAALGSGRCRMALGGKIKSQVLQEEHPKTMAHF